MFNPALTGASGADVQVGLQYRKQWSSVATGFTTMGALAEMRGRNTGFGLHIHQNHAGEGSLKTTGVMFSGAYHKPMGKSSELSLGVAVGRLQKRFDPASFTYDNQFVEGQGFETTIASGETFARTGAAMTDVAVGLNWSGLLRKNGKLRGHGGFALSHVHRPDEGFTGFVEELPMKTTVTAAVDIRVGDQFDLTPHLLFQRQDVHREIVLGAMVDGQLAEHSKILFGMAYRLYDAFIGQVGVEHRNKKMFFSYDANSSDLKLATNGNGAWEIGLYLTFDRKEKKQLTDTDGDGVFDHRDNCPDTPGLARLAGCPEEEKKEKKEKRLKKKDKPEPREKEMERDIDDADGDGVADDIDLCPLERGLPCFYGCNDRDRDGTIDPEDSCPEIFGPHDNNGCPISGRDSDRDGIPDDEDYCVYLKGVIEFHGCPDSDRDGVSDVDDHCPYLKGVPEHDGCPPELSPRNGGATSVIVEFDSNLSDLKPEFTAQLDEFVNTIPVGTNFRVVVSGHTDAEGAAFYNSTLSQRRADRVMDYLVRKGIPYNRVQTIPYGEAVPRKSNDTSFGKARNRRCEVSLIVE